MTKSLWINDHWHDGKGAPLQSFNPVDDRLLWQGNSADESQVDTAVQAARDAFSQWRDLTYQQRYQYIENFTQLVEQNKTDLAELISAECGKALWDANTEVAAMLGKALISLKAYEDRTGLYSKSISQGQLSVSHQPHGVLAVFGPYNFPAHLPNGHIVPALLAGNCVVFKPSELTPAVAEFVMKLWQQVKLPAGVLNLVLGEKQTGMDLAKHAQLDGILFTGSATTGCLLHQQLAAQPQKMLALEMGGNNPLVVEEISDIQAALFIVLFSAFVSSGQRCTCARRLLLPDNEWGDAFLHQLISATSKLTSTFMGALISSAASQRLQQQIQQLQQLGGKVMLASSYGNSNQTIMSPTIVDMSAVTQFYDEELFGPVLQIYRYQTLEHAVQQCNQTRFGLAAGLITEQASSFAYFQKNIRAGIVNCNKPLTGASSEAPFGGVGVSGNGRPSAYYAADYCAYPVASIVGDSPQLPDSLAPGLDQCLNPNR